MKKVLYVFLSLIAAAILALVIMGSFVREIQYTTTIRAKASIDDVWNTFMDTNRKPEWLGGFQKSEHLSGEPLAVGSEYRHYFEEGTSFVEKVTAIEPHQKYSFDMETDLFTGSVTVSFETMGDAVRIQQHTSMNGSTFMWRALLPLFKPLMQRQQMDSLDKLADVIEDSPTLIDKVQQKTPDNREE